jgi:hypothetical protein
MERLFKNSKRLMASLGLVAFLMVAGWQFGIGSTESQFSETEVALENALEGSGGSGSWTCYSTYSECWFWGCSTIYRCGSTCETVSADAFMDASTCQ